MGATGIWGDLEKFFNNREGSKSIDLLERLKAAPKDYEDIARSATTMAELNLHNTKDDEHIKSIGYGLVAGYAYLLSKRMAPAVAALEWLKKNTPEAQDEIELLEQGIKATFTKGEAKPRDFFSQVSDKEVTELLQMVQIKDLQKGDVLFNEKDPSDAFYIIAEGCIHLSNSRGLSKDLEEGDFFGELGVLGREPRTATATAARKTRILVFHEDDLGKAFEKHPNLEKKVVRHYEIRFFLNAVLDNIYFRDFSEEELEEFFSFFRTGSSRKGATIIDENNDKRFLIFLLRGRVAVLKEGEEVASFGATQFLGEVRLVKNKAANATVIAVENLRYLFCTEENYAKLIERFPKLKTILEELAEVREAVSA